eukprot:CAMPEP_0169207130 /NCGR_PEP_ID=MMETSP1016-20121227/13410_1 /TAXON_ID=342587 /ORGANISM="Karlodinium micrum, Strain CCMP2283" /LENGTH=47 /DNA_ID= /DNA_START= /DNA_END= /DNA_ORIENTATION=
MKNAWKLHLERALVGCNLGVAEAVGKRTETGTAEAVGHSFGLAARHA